jgi:glycosyltransferase involved in cell wall biosynthesis
VTRPLVSVVTPTWERHDALISRAVPSVQAQTYPNVEHIVVSDGPDPALREKLMLELEGLGGGRHRLVFDQVEHHDPDARWGHWPRLTGIGDASGEYIAYLDDDNAWHPQHLDAIVGRLEESGADFGYSRMQVRGSWGDPRYIVGAEPPVYGQIDTSLIVHRRALLEVGTWEQSMPSIDWDLVARWITGGASWVFYPHITADYYLAAGR